ncbi:membrane protein [Candidatus Marinamargulisbacteria bacterium SCGC AG-410-N11]|nr:membrane protein [Candidatus Marinamargulisbacteria bacterium SCGC AG-410-N11]
MLTKFINVTANRFRILILFLNNKKESAVTYDFFYGRYLFLKFLAIIYFVAFGSLFLQIDGLYSSTGITPIIDYIALIKNHFQDVPFLKFPTIFAWFNSDFFINSIGLLGILLSIIAFFYIGSWPILALLWLLYLSFTSVGQAFLSFQWDILLLEVGFLALFLCSFDIRKQCHDQPVNRWVIWAFRILLFRLMFGSGVVKLFSGDPTWLSFTALTYHYYTQPLPHIGGWIMHQLPNWLHRLSVFIMFVIELLFPWLILVPFSFARKVCFYGIVLLMAMIILTGNYCFFNFLTISLCIFLLKDSDLAFFSWFKNRVPIKSGPLKNRSLYLIGLPCLISAVIILLGLNLELARFYPTLSLRHISSISTQIMSFRIVNTYGLFANMTTQRYEIEISGSFDGKHWEPYQFKYKPNDTTSFPGWVQPYHPRLDWQMWFAALGHYKHNDWYIKLLVRLLHNESSVLNLLQTNPFQQKPPTYIRATRYRYQFTTVKQFLDTGEFWVKDYKGLYSPPITLTK